MKIRIEQIDAETCNCNFAENTDCMIATSLKRLGYENVYVTIDKVYINAINPDVFLYDNTPSYEIANAQGYLYDYTDNVEGNQTPLGAAYSWKKMGKDEFVPFEIEVVDLPPLEKV